MLDSADSYTKCNTLPSRRWSRDTGQDFNHHEEVLAHDVPPALPGGEVYARRAQKARVQPVRDRPALGRHRSTVCREVRRNSTRSDGHYRAFTAQERTNGRRSRSRRNGLLRPRSSPRSRGCCAGSGAPNRSPATCAGRGCSRSATRPSTAMSGGTSARAAPSTPTCAGLGRGGVSAMALTTAAADWLASA